MIDEDAEESAVDGGFEIRVGEKDVGRLAAEFESDALHGVRGLLDDDLADGGAAGESDFVDVGMLDERSAAGLAETGDDVDDARRQAAVGEMFREFKGGERSLLGRLEDAGTTGGQRWRQFPRGHQQRIIPRDDLSGNADRFFEREAHGVVGDRIHIANDLGGKTTIIFEASGDVVEVVLGFDDRLAGVAALEFGECGQVLTDFVGETEEDAAAFLRGCGRPWTFFEGGLGGGDGTVDVVGRGVRDLSDHFFGRGIVDREGLRGLACDPFAVDEHLVGFHVGLNSTGHDTGPPVVDGPTPFARIKSRGKLCRPTGLGSFFTAYPGLLPRLIYAAPTGLERADSIVTAPRSLPIPVLRSMASCARRTAEGGCSHTDQIQRRASLAATGESPVSTRLIVKGTSRRALRRP